MMSRLITPPGPFCALAGAAPPWARPTGSVAPRPAVARAHAPGSASSSDAECRREQSTGWLVVFADNRAEVHALDLAHRRCDLRSDEDRVPPDTGDGRGPLCRLALKVSRGRCLEGRREPVELALPDAYVVDDGHDAIDDAPAPLGRVRSGARLGRRR